MDDIDPAKAAALREIVEAERQRRFEEKLAKGEIDIKPIICGVPPAREKNTKDVGFLDPRTGEPAIRVIVTGVPRAGRDDDEDLAAYVARAPVAENPYNPYARLTPVETVSVPTLPRPTPEEPVSESRHKVRCTVRGPNPEKDDPGQIIEATYSLTGNALRVYDDSGRVLGSERLEPGDDAVAAARKIIREKHGKHGAFYDPIRFRNHTV